MALKEETLRINVETDGDFPRMVQDLKGLIERLDTMHQTACAACREAPASHFDLWWVTSTGHHYRQPLCDVCHGYARNGHDTDATPEAVKELVRIQMERFAAGIHRQATQP
jgi:hypothetical protein